MENNILFTLINEKLNRRIAKLNILISKDSDNISLKTELQQVLADKQLLYKGNTEDLEKLKEKYGEFING